MPEFQLGTTSESEFRNMDAPRAQNESEGAAGRVCERILVDMLWSELDLGKGKFLQATS